MNREESLKLLTGGKEGIEEWNQWRHSGEQTPDLRGADLRGADLCGTDIMGADLSDADLQGANLREAHLIAADLTNANLSNADLRDASLGNATLFEANLIGADLTSASLSRTALTNVDLSETKGLRSVKHFGPSTLGIDSIIKSRGRIPEDFLSGCGVPESWIANMPALIGSLQPIQFYSCFLSHSTVDKDFARRLHSRMRDEGMRVWFDEFDMQSGKKIHEQIEEAIRLHDRLLIVLSPHSMKSEWVKTELRRAFKQERREGKRKLFPIGLSPYAVIREWECFDADHGKDLALEVREYYIPDFSAWKDNDVFEAAFARLMKDFKAENPLASRA
jgi:uncharacterized protein YjbI with pentapeptide repeats